MHCFLFLYQVRGTIFNELDDEKILKQIDTNEFEERFKIGIGGALHNGSNGSEVDGALSCYPSKRFKKLDNVSLLEHTRLRNIGKLQFKTNLSTYYRFNFFPSNLSS